ncbi:MAG: CoA transferase [Acidimicrobiales bacterium]|nr:CoA transferase [Acidimicrobiales bacterium]
MTGPLDGVRVVEVASHVFVPMAGAVLTEWGADVVKVEHPVTGDPYRGLATVGLHKVHLGVDLFFLAANRGKRSVGIDLADPDGRALLSRLVAGADVFVTNLRPAARAKLRIDVDDVRADNPDVVYVRGTAFGSRGPDAGRGGYDTGAYWARSGMAHLVHTATGASGAPPAPRPAFGDVVGGLGVAGAVCAALYRRATTGTPSVIDASLLASGMWQVQTDLVDAAVSGRDATPPAPPSRDEVWNPLMLPYRTADDRWVALMVLTPDRHWPRLCALLGRPELADDPRFADLDARRAHATACVAALDDAFATRTLAEWTEVLAAFEGEWAPVQSPAEVVADPQVAANGYLADVDVGADVGAGEGTIPLVTAPVQFDGAPARPTRAPEHGEDTEAVLLDLGLTWEELAALKSRGTIV